jgi:hypothetical protein
MEGPQRETLRPTNEELQVLFSDAIRECGVATIDCVDGPRHLWMRAVLPTSNDVRRGDTLRAGVAMRTRGDDVLVHPFLMREICTNGAVRAHALSTRVIARQRIDVAIASAPGYSLDIVRAELSTAVQCCASADSFRDGVSEMRAALEVDADQVIDMLQFTEILSSLGRSLAAQSVFRVLSRLTRQVSQAGGRERTAFALGNALTAAGRDAATPAARWALEEYGAAVFGACLSPSAPPVATLRGRAIASDRATAR